MSLSRHLTSPAGAHGRLAFHPDCPRCCAERLAGQLGGDELVARRAQAALAAGVLAISAAAPTVAVAQEPVQQQEGATDPGGEPPEMAPDFDPGGDEGDNDVVELGPLPGGDQGGGEDDDGDGVPVEADDPPIYNTPAPAPPVPAEPAPPAAAEPPPPGPTPPIAAPAPPASEMPAPPAAEAPAPTAPEEPTRDVSAPERSKPADKPHWRALTRERPTGMPAPAPVPAVPAPAPSSPEAPAAVVAAPSIAVSQPAGRLEPAVTGATYTVRQGDSLWSIARRLQGAEASNGQLAREVARLWRLNEQRIGTGDPSMLHIGTVLRLR